MSNIVLANVLPAAQPAPQDSDIVKGSSGKTNTGEQNDVSGSGESDNIFSSSESPDTNPTAKGKQKEDFTSILQKQLSGNASSENPQTLESQETGENPAAIVNENSESVGKIKSKTDGETEEDMTGQILLGGFLVLQSSQTLPKQVSSVTSGSKIVDSDSQQVKTAQTVTSATAQMTMTSRQNAVPTATVTDKSSTAFSQVVADASKKITTDAVEIKNTSTVAQNAINPANPTSPTNLANPVLTDAAGTSGQKQTDNIGNSAASNFTMTKKSVAKTQGQLKTSSVGEADKIAGELNQQTKSSALQSIPAESVQAGLRTTASTRSDVELLTQSVSASAGAEKASFQQAFLKPSEQIIDQIQTTINGPAQQIRITLSPEELGTVRITFRQADGQMEGLVEVQNSEVRKEVEKALPQIAAALTQNGIQIRRMDITSLPTQQQTNQETFQSPGRDFGAADQYYSAGQGGSGSPKGGGSADVSQQFAEQTDSSQSRPRQNFDMAGLNMYA